MSDDASRSLRFKITLAPPRVTHSSSLPPPLSVPSAAAVSPPSHVVDVAHLRQVRTAADATTTAAPAPPAHNNFILAAVRGPSPPLRGSVPDVHPSPPLSTSANLVHVAFLGRDTRTAPAPQPSTAPRSTQHPFDFAGGSAHWGTAVAAPVDAATYACRTSGPAPLPPPSHSLTTTGQASPGTATTATAASPRYGGAILRISELRQQGVDILLPTMTSSSRVPPPRPQGSTRVPSAPHALPPHQTFSQIFAPAPVDTMDPVDRELGLAPRRTSRGGRAGGARGRGRGSSATLDLQPDGTPYEYRWYVQGGRRVLVYNNRNYKGKTAHKMWTQIKKANGATGTRAGGRKTKAARPPKGRPAAKKSGRGATASSSRVRRDPLDRPLSLDFHGGVTPTVTGSIPSFASITLGDTPPRHTTQTQLAPPRRTPVKVPVRSAPHTALQNALAEAAGRTASASHAPVTRGLATLSFVPSVRAQAASVRAGGTTLRATTTTGSSGGSQTHRDDTAVVVVTDSDGEDNGPTSGGEQQRHPNTDRVGRKRGRDDSGRGKRHGGDEDGVHQDETSLGEWPDRYLDSTASSASDSFSSLSSWTSSTDDESDSAFAEEGPAAPATSGSTTVVTTPRTVVVDGHTLVEVDGWLYPPELLPSVTQASSTAKSRGGTEDNTGPEKKRHLQHAQEGSGDAYAAQVNSTSLPTTQPRRVSLVDPCTSTGTTDRLHDDGRRTASGLLVLGVPGVQPTRKATSANGTLVTGGRGLSAAAAAHRAGPETHRYAEDGVFDALTTTEGMDDLFEVGEEIGGFRF